jgi:glycosyltransferase involved in cell wall biosynthesis
VEALYFSERLLQRKPDVLHAHFGSSPASVACTLSEAIGVPWGVSLHAKDLYGEDNDLPTKLRSCSHVVTCSRVSRDDVSRLLQPDAIGKVYCVHHGIDVDAWMGHRNTLFETSSPLAIAIGRYESKKGFSILLQACQLLASAGVDIRCAIIGDGPERQSLKRICKELGLCERVQFVEWCTEDELRHWFSRASALVVPSVIAKTGDRDNIPNVMIEAMSCGVPVVASALPALRELLGTVQAGVLFEPGSAVGLAAALKSVIACRRESERLAVAGRQLATAEFDQKFTVAELHRILRRSAVCRM